MKLALKLPIANERGEALTAFAPHEDGWMTSHMAPAMSLVMARHPQGVPIVHNKWRKVWELPGGFMEPGETPEEGALREFEEETGLRGFSIELLGLLEIRRLSKDLPNLYCALYQCVTEGVPLPQDTDEVSEVAFWSPGSRLGPISEIDKALLEEYWRHECAEHPHAALRER